MLSRVSISVNDLTHFLTLSLRFGVQRLEPRLFHQAWCLSPSVRSRASGGYGTEKMRCVKLHKGSFIEAAARRRTHVPFGDMAWPVH